MSKYGVDLSWDCAPSATGIALDETPFSRLPYMTNWKTEFQ